MTILTSRAHVLGTALLCVGAVPAAAQSQLPIDGQVVAQPGDQAPGFAPGETFGTTNPFDAPIMTRDGNILFRGTVAGGSVTPLDNKALFVGRTGADLALVARTNTTVLDPINFPNSVPVGVSGSTGLPFTSNTGITSSYRISPLSNIVLFGAQMYDSGNPGLDGLVHTSSAGTVNDKFLFWGQPGALLVLAQTNATTMPGGAVLSSSFTSFSQQSTGLNSFGTATFKSNLAGGDVTGSSDDSAWITGVPGSLSYFVREGTTPYLGGAVVQGTLGTNCVINENGQILHDETLSTTLGTTPATFSDDKVVIVATPAGPGTWNHTFIMREGDTAPDATGAPMPGVTYLNSPTLAQGFTNSGKAAFHSSLSGGSAATALFVYDGAATKLAVQQGDVVPGTGGETVNVINSSASLTEAGLLFGCSLSGASVTTNDSALCIANPGQPLQLLVREGDACPGMPGFVFGRMTGSSNFGSSSAHKMNEDGSVVFNLAINDGVADTTSSTWTWHPLHGLTLQLMAGDSIGAGTVTSASTPSLFPGGDGSTLGFTENGDWVAEHSISGGSIIVRGHVGSLQATPSAVPAAGGVAHTMNFDVGPTFGNHFYFILATSQGTDVGFPHPLNAGVHVPIDFDPLWTGVSLSFNNTAIWFDSFGVTDVDGKAVSLPNFPNPAAPSFNVPLADPDFLSFQGTTIKHSVILFDGALVGTYATEPATCYLY
jgi:hypothetical protein